MLTAAHPGRGARICALATALGLAATVPPALAGTGTLSLVISRDVENLDPHSTGAWQSGMVRELVYDNLVDWDDAGQPVPALATDWTVSPDRLTYVFHLRPGVRFTDGSPLDAAAVKASFDRLLAPTRHTAASSQLGFIAKVAVVDPATIALTTRSVNPLVLRTLGTGLAAIVSPADIARYGARIIERPIGSGPYIFASWRTGDQLVLRRNPAWWGGEAGLDRIVVKAAPDASVRLTALGTGEVQLAELIAPTDYATVQADHGLKLLSAGGARFVAFNLATTHGPTADPRVRQAMNDAIDKQAIIDALLGGQGQVADSPVGPRVAGYHAVGAYRYDPVRARALLKAAHYDTSQILHGIYPTGRFPAKDVSEAAQAMLAQVGIRIELAGYPDMTQYNAAEKRLDRVDMAYTAFYPSVMDADSAMFIRYRSGQVLDYNYDNPAVDALLDTAQTSPDGAARDSLYARAQTAIWNDAPFIGLFYPTVQSAASVRLQGVKYYPNERLSVKWASFSK